MLKRVTLFLFTLFSICSYSQTYTSFTSFGTYDSYVPVVFQCVNSNGIKPITIHRNSIHQDRDWLAHGTVNITAIGFGWGSGGNSIRLDNFTNGRETVDNTGKAISFLGRVVCDWSTNNIVVFLRGGTTYQTDGVVVRNDGQFQDLANSQNFSAVSILDPLYNIPKGSYFSDFEINAKTAVFSTLANGNVGIGTTTPTEKLTIKGNDAKIRFETTSDPANYFMTIESNWNSSNTFNIKDGNILKFGSKEIGKGTNDTYMSGYYGLGFATETTTVSPDKIRMYITQNGNVGVGTVNPLGRLHVGNNTGLGVVINDRVPAVTNKIPAQIGWGESGMGLAGDLIIAPRTDISTSVRFFTNNGQNTEERLRISGNGNIGIGTTNPISKLDLGSNYSNPSSYPNKITLWSSGANNYFGMGISEGSFDYFSQGQHRFFVGYNGSPGIEVLTLKASGNAALQGKFEAKEIKVTTTPTADFVFANDYSLPKLEEVEKHIKDKKHLPEIASAKEMEKEGVNVGEFQIKLLQKIEELTLYVIDQNKEIKDLKRELNELKTKK